MKKKPVVYKNQDGDTIDKNGEAPTAEVNTAKPVDVTSTADLRKKVPTVIVTGNPEDWQLVCKVSCREQGWMKSTKAMNIDGRGVLVQVTTETQAGVAEALEYIPGAVLRRDGNGNTTIS